jgi:thioredoxin-like negative regulator of GroEL
MSSPLPMPRPSILAMATILVFLLVASPVRAQQNGLKEGLQLYFERRDQAAITMLEAQSRQGVASRFTRMALADLYFSAGRFTRARQELARLSEEGPLDDFTLWLAWIDFAMGRAADAQRSLADVIATAESHEFVSRAVLTLGWQLLLRGRAAEAADVFAAPGTSETLPVVEDQLRLLRGQALMFAGDVGDAEQALATVTGASLRADAARDIAWCRYTRGERDAAREALEAIADSEDAGASPLRVAWPSVLRHGPRLLGRRWETLYRERTRGQDPTTFLLTLADRNAAADARAMLRAFFLDETAAADVASADPAHRLSPHRQNRHPDPVADQGQQRPTRPRISSWTAVHGILLFLVAIVLLIGARARSARRRTAK